MKRFLSLWAVTVGTLVGSLSVSSCGQQTTSSRLESQSQADYSQAKGTLQYLSRTNASAKFKLRTTSDAATLFIDNGIIDEVESMRLASIEPDVRCMCVVYAGRDYVAIVESLPTGGKAKVWYRSEYPGKVKGI